MYFKSFYINLKNTISIWNDKKKLKMIKVFQILPVAAVKEIIPLQEPVTDANKYWVKHNVNEVIIEADKLYMEKKYLVIYEMLNRLKYAENVEIQWRICRVLYKMSCDTSLSTKVRNEMIYEAHNLMTNATNLGYQNSNFHKWMAIILYAKTGLQGIVVRVKSYTTIKNHLLQSYELNPRDVCVLYMLGKWCFDVSNLTWVQRKLSYWFFAEQLRSTYQEAYEYLYEAEEMQPRFYLPNLYLLGRTSFYLKQYFRARYYLQVASQMNPRSAFEERCAFEAQKWANRLNTFDTSEQTVKTLIYETL